VITDKGLEAHRNVVEHASDLIDRAKADVARVLRQRGLDEIDSGTWHKMVGERMDVLEPKRPKYRPATDNGDDND
jgi:hypothetical protein